MTKELKQAIEENLNKHRHETILHFEGYKKMVNWILQDPSILRHCDPEITKQAGWVREEEQPFKGFTVADMKRAMEFAAIIGWDLELGVSAKFREREKMIENYIKSIIVTT